jgi:hypothetical protein
MLRETQHRLYQAQDNRLGVIQGQLKAFVQLRKALGAEFFGLSTLRVAAVGFSAQLCGRATHTDWEQGLDQRT